MADNRVVRRSTFSEAISTHTCERCGRIFNDLRGFRRHLREVHGPRVRCKYCGADFSIHRSYDLQIHESKCQRDNYRATGRFRKQREQNSRDVRPRDHGQTNWPRDHGQPAWPRIESQGQNQTQRPVVNRTENQPTVQHVQPLRPRNESQGQNQTQRPVVNRTENQPTSTVQSAGQTSLVTLFEDLPASPYLNVDLSGNPCSPEINLGLYDQSHETMNLFTELELDSFFNTNATSHQQETVPSSTTASTVLSNNVCSTTCSTSASTNVSNINDLLSNNSGPISLFTADGKEILLLPQGWQAVQTNVPTETSRTETNVQREIPGTETNVQRETQRTETNIQRETPRTETNVQREIPGTETNVQRERDTAYRDKYTDRDITAYRDERTERDTAYRDERTDRNTAYRDKCTERDIAYRDKRTERDITYRDECTERDTAYRDKRTDRDITYRDERTERDTAYTDDYKD